MKSSAPYPKEIIESQVLLEISRSSADGRAGR